MTVDLHLHTHHSDGNWSPSELVERAIALKLKTIAITDHDTVAGIDEAEEAAAGRIEIIPGVEINTVWHGANGVDEDIHILGYFIDRQHKALISLFARQQYARRKHVLDTIERLTELGINLTVSQIEACAGIGSIGRPHITQAIVNAGYAESASAAYEQFMTRGSAHYVPRKSVTSVDAVCAIRDAGGIASLAHPWQSSQIRDIILELKSCGLQAIEAYHRRHSVDLVQHYIRFANRNGLIVTGGSDCHGPSGEYLPSIGTISVPREVVGHLRMCLKANQGVSALSI